jgi:hypothetical protein
MYLVINRADCVVSSGDFLPVPGGMQIESGLAVFWKR